VPGIDFRRLRSDIGIVDVLELLGFVAATRIGEQVRGECPLHTSTRPGRHRTFSANLARNTFQCFKCKAAGNRLDLWAKATNQPIHQAAQSLCDRLNREVPWLAARTEKRNT
jgi:DNA primase